MSNSTRPYSNRSAWNRVKRNAPCPICSKPDWCEVSADGEVALCMRVQSEKPSRNGGWIHRLKESNQPSPENIIQKPFKLHDKADADLLDQVYRALLDLLPLSSTHEMHLGSRGLTTEQIRQQGYKSLPGTGRSRIVKTLVDMFAFEVMETVPGFMVADNGRGIYPTLAGNTGILIPVKNSREQIIGLQIRIDNPNQGDSRYKWLSSASRPNGTGSGTPAHVARPTDKKGERIWITEGALKANIAADYLGEVVIGVAGVSNWRSGKVLNILSELKATTVILAYDADIVEKSAVRLHRDQLAQECFKSNYEVLITSWPLEQAKGLDDLLVAGGNPEMTVWVDKPTGNGLLTDAWKVVEAIKERLEDDPGAVFEQKSREALRILQVHDPASWARIKPVLKKAGVSLTELNRALKADERLESQKSKERDREHIKSEDSIIAKIFEDPALSQMTVPGDWLLTEKGISQIKYKPNGEFDLNHVTHFPVIITARARDIDEGDEYFTLNYKKEEKVYTLTVDRKTISEQRCITQLSEKGFPVNSVNAKQMIRYLEDFEAGNIAYLKKSNITHGFGHKCDTKGKGIYYLPHCAYNTDETLTFCGRGPGDNEFFKALQPKGTLEDWIEIIKSYCAPYPRVMFHIYSGFATSLLELFGCSQSFTIHTYAMRSSGKTAENEAVASIYGNPAKLTLQWDHITQVAAEQLAGLCNGVPIFLEDSQNADERKISTMIYMIANSVGKARGHKFGGLQKTLTWLTILFSTGERKLFDQLKKGGAEARTISFWGSPFGIENDRETGRKVRELKRLVHQNYGTAIRPYLDYIYRLGHERLMKYYEDAYKFIEARITSAGEVHRHIDYFAYILAAGELAEEVFHIGRDPHEMCEQVLELFQQEGIGDTVTEAMEDVVSWMNSNDNLYDISGKPREGKDGEYGTRHGVKNPGEYIAVLPHIVKEFMIKQGYSPSMIMKAWKERGWIQGEERNFTYPVSFRGRHVRMIKIPWKIFHSCGEGVSKEPPKSL